MTEITKRSRTVELMDRLTLLERKHSKLAIALESLKLDSGATISDLRQIRETVERLGEATGDDNIDVHAIKDRLDALVADFAGTTQTTSDRLDAQRALLDQALTSSADFMRRTHTRMDNHTQAITKLERDVAAIHRNGDPIPGPLTKPSSPLAHQVHQASPLASQNDGFEPWPLDVVNPPQPTQRPLLHTRKVFVERALLEAIRNTVDDMLSRQPNR